jgi:hypothetical protein
VNAWKRRVLNQPHPVVADDVRFSNEVDVVRQLGGIVVRVDRPVVAQTTTPRRSGAVCRCGFSAVAICRTPRSNLPSIPTR